MADYREDPNAFVHNPERWSEFHGDDCQRCSAYRKEQRAASLAALERAVVEAALAWSRAEADSSIDGETLSEFLGRLGFACSALAAARGGEADRG